MSEEYTYTMVYSQQLIRSAVWAFIRRHIDWKIIVAVLLLILSCFYLYHRAENDITLGIFIGAIFLYPAPLVLGFILQYRSAYDRFSKMGKPEVKLVLSETETLFTSERGHAGLKWQTFPALWKFSEFWLLFTAPNQFSILPLAGIDEKGQSFILKKLSEHKIPIS